MDFEQNLEHWNRQVTQRLTKAGELREAMRDLQVTAESPQSRVKVTVDASGSLIGLFIAERAIRQGNTAADLADEILRCFHQATRELAQRIQLAAAPIIGTDSETMVAMNQNLRERFERDEESDPTGAQVDPQWRDPARRRDSHNDFGWQE